MLAALSCSFLSGQGFFFEQYWKTLSKEWILAKLIRLILTTQIKSWTSVLYGNKASSSSLIASLHSRFPRPAYSFKVASALSRCACLTERLETRAWRGQTFRKRNSIQLQLKKSQNLVNLTNVKCQHPVKLQKWRWIFLSAYHGCQLWLRLGKLSFKMSVLLPGGGKKVTTISIRANENLYRMLHVTPMIFHCFSVGHHFRGCGTSYLIHIVLNSLNHNPFQQSYPSLYWKPVNMALKRDIQTSPEYSPEKLCLFSGNTQNVGYSIWLILLPLKEGFKIVQATSMQDWTETHLQNSSS